MLAHVFVYGTLKRGECREICWPSAPAMIRPAWTTGALYDIGPYPALVAGSDRVLGELWSFPDEELPRVLAVLDAIEGTNQPGQHNEYNREVATVTLVDLSPSSQPQTLQASIYRYARIGLLSASQRLEPTLELANLRFAVWSSGNGSPLGKSPT